jgi:hypothetical protein
MNKTTWRNLMKQGYKLHEIDAMDIFYLFDLFAEEEQKTIVYAEQVPWL